MIMEYWTDFEKRQGSTKRPSVNGSETEIALKQPASIYSPVVMVSGGDFISSPPRYARIKDIYYSVDDVQSYREGVWILSMNIDVLATARDDIAATSAYIVRASSDFNEMLGDSLVVPELSTSITGASVPTGVFDDGECYIFQILDGRAASPAGFLTPYAMIGSSMAELAAQLTQADIIGELFMTMADVTACLGECMMVPVSASKIAGSPATIYCGHFNTGVSSKAVSNPIVSGKATLTIPWKYSDFRRNSPFSTVMLYLPYIGNVNISTNDINSYDSLDVYTTLDVLTGVVAYSVQAGTGGIVIGEYSAKAGATIPTSTYMSNVVTGISEGFGAALGAGVSAGTGNIVGLLGAAGGAVNAGFSLTEHTAQIRGAQGSLAQSWQSLPFLRCEVITRDSSTVPSSIAARMGRPLHAMRTIGSLTGYVQTLNADINAKWPATIKQQINRMLDGGIYFE